MEAEQPDIFSNIFGSTKKLFETSGMKAIDKVFQKFELNPNPLDLLPSNLTDQQFDFFMQLPDQVKQGDMTDWIIKSHHQINGTVCAIEGCQNELGIANGKFNCLKCGNLVCFDHSRFQIKLSVDARHDPVNGFWAQCCQRCYVLRPGYGMTPGVTRNKSGSYMKIRSVKSAATRMELNKLEKRLAKIKSFLQETESQSLIDKVQISLNSLSEFPQDPLAVIKSNRIIVLTQAIDNVVVWIPDEAVDKCVYCKKVFSFTNRKHHCRLCGNVICDDCSRNIEDAKTVRGCKECTRLLSLRNRETTNEEKPVIKLEAQMTRYKQSLKLQMDKFNNLLIDLQRENIQANDQDYQLALKTRKTCLELFAEMDQIAKHIKGLPSGGSLESKLHQNIFISTMQFLQDNMFTLQLMPSVKSKMEMPKVVSDTVFVLQDNIEALNKQMKELILKRKFEDAELMREQIVVLEAELNELTNT